MNEPAKMVKTIRTIKGFIDWLEEVKGRFVLYRGLADAAWEVESSAYRRIKRSQGEAPPRVFQNYIEQLLNRAGLQGFKRRGGEELSELELLAKLQHNGAATCLIDFTENALVALWFVCREKPKKAGKVVAMATEESEEFSIVTYERLEKPIKEFLNQGKLWKWTPERLEQPHRRAELGFRIRRRKDRKRALALRRNQGGCEQQGRNQRGAKREIRNLRGITFQRFHRLRSLERAR